MDLVVNELAFEHLCDSEFEAEKRMATFIATIRSLTALGFARQLWVTREFLAIELLNDYPITRWLNNTTIPVAERMFVKTILSKGPFLEDTIEEHVLKRKGVFDFEHERKSAKGLGLAWLVDGPAVSVEHAPPFEKDPVTIQVASHANESEAEDFDIENYEVCCLTFTAQVEERKTWLKERVAKSKLCSSGAELIASKDELFPNLIFCDSTIKQIRKLTGSEPWFLNLLDHCRALNEKAGSWVDGDFDLGEIDWSDESSQTLKSAKLKKMRTFKCPDGDYRLMSRHTKIKFANIRIHFLPVKSSKTCYVGYIGIHLEVFSD